MVPRRRRSWFSRLGSIAGPERIGAALVVLTVFGEGRHHADTVEASAAEDRNVATARIIRLERVADSVTVRLRYVERQVRVLRGKRVRRSPGADVEPYGPGFAPAERGHLLASVGKAFRHLVFWLPDN